MGDERIDGPMTAPDPREVALRVPFRVWLWAWLWWPFDAWNNWKNCPTTGGGED